MQEIDYLTSGTTRPSVATIQINGYSFTLTYLRQVGAKRWAFTLPPIQLSLIGVTNPVGFTQFSISYLACGTVVDADILSTPFSPTPPTTATCQLGTIQPSATSPSSGQLALSVPVIIGAPFTYPPYYQFQYRVVGTATWFPATPIQVTQSQYTSGPFTVTGLNSGVYEIQGRDVCTDLSTSPWVPGPNNITVN